MVLGRRCGRRRRRADPGCKIARFLTSPGLFGQIEEEGRRFRMTPPSGSGEPESGNRQIRTGSIECLT